MRPLVEAYHDAVGVYVKLATSFYKLVVELFGFRFVEPMQPGGQPPIAAIRQDGHRDIDVHIEAHFTGQAVEVKEIDTDRTSGGIRARTYGFAQQENLRPI